MARIKYVKKAQKDQGKCFNCGTDIKAGDSYKHTSMKTSARSSMKRKWCGTCVPRPSQTTLSKMAGIYAAQENFDDEVKGIAPTTWEAATDAKTFLETALETCADGIREVAEQYEESAQNIEDGFGHATYQSEELQDKAQELNDWAETVASVDIEDPLAADEWAEQNGHEIDGDGTWADEEAEQEYADALGEWFDEQLDNARSEVENCPV